MKAVECMFVVVLIKLLAISNALTPSHNEPPKITEGPIHMMVIYGSTLILKCRTSGDPKPSIEWQFNGNKIQGIGFEILPSGDLKLDYVNYSDGGEYSCEVKNEHGIIKESAKVKVLRRTKVFTDSHIQEVGVGQTTILRCKEMHDDNLSIEIEWLRDGKSIDYDKQDRYSKLNDGSLGIYETIGPDSGEYTCVARTDVDEASALITLVVQDVPNKPIIEAVSCNELKAVITWKPQGDNRSPILFYTLEYNTSFTPEKWEVGVAKVRSSNFTFFMTPWANYSFRLIAQNKLGPSYPSEHSKICTTLPDVPYKNPGNVKTEAGDPTNLIITWTPMPEIEHNGPKLYYRVFWKRDIPHVDWESKDVFDWQESKVVVSGQPLFVKYLVKVVAINEIGESKDPAKEVIGYSGEDRPLMAPTNFKMLNLESSTSAWLQWDPVSPESLRGEFKGYKLQTWTAAEGEELLREIRVDNNINKVLFTKLKPYSKNFVQLCAYNSRFDGPKTVISFATPEGYPSEVQDLQAYALSSTDMLVTWDKPLEPNGQLTGYRIYYENVRDRYGESEQFLYDQLATSARLTNLEPGTSYKIQVYAQTAMGKGPGSFIYKATLGKQGMPQEPSKPNFKWEPLISIKVNWQPFNGEPTGTHFFTQYRIKGETEWHDAREEKHGAYQIISNLNINSVYEFRVVSVYGDYRKESEIQEIKTF